MRVDTISMERFWGVFFGMMLFSYLFRVLTRKKWPELGRSGLLDKLIVASLPAFLFMMLNDSKVSALGRIIDSLLALSSIASGVWLLWVVRMERRRRQDGSDEDVS